MDQQKKTVPEQVFYQDKWVSKQHFRVFVYNEKGQKLAKSYDEYLKLIESGEWFSSIDEVKPKQEPLKAGRKPKHGTDS